MKIIRILILASVFTLSVLNQWSFAQSTSSSDSLKYRSFRIGLIPGVSSLGSEALLSKSRFSVNLLAGAYGALDTPESSQKSAFEFGTLINYNRVYSRGFQVAGLGNHTPGTAEGFLLAGLYNYADQGLAGFSYSGLFSYTSGTMEGLTLSGGALVANSIDGLSSAPFMVAEDITGLSLYGLAVADDIEGLGVGILGISEDVEGLQVGAVNVTEELEGLQVGFVNAVREVEGLQVGAVNLSGDVTGLQVGWINIGNSLEGMPVGLLSFYKEGRHDLDVWTSDHGVTNIGLKLGVDEVYNMISAGFYPFSEDALFQLGWSIGFKVRERSKYTDIFDFSIFRVFDEDAEFDEEWFEESWNEHGASVFKLRYLRTFDLARGLQVYVGPTLSLVTSGEEVKRSLLDQIAPYDWLSFGGKKYNARIWLGYSLGVELF